jgi:hypothetical protein
MGRGPVFLNTLVKKKKGIFEKYEAILGSKDNMKIIRSIQGNTFKIKKVYKVIKLKFKKYKVYIYMKTSGLHCL